MDQKPWTPSLRQAATASETVFVTLLFSVPEQHLMTQAPSHALLMTVMTS